MFCVTFILSFTQSIFLPSLINCTIRWDSRFSSVIHNLSEFKIHLSEEKFLSTEADEEGTEIAVNSSLLYVGILLECFCWRPPLAYHLVGPGSIIGRFSFTGWGFFRGFRQQLDKCQEKSGTIHPQISLAIIIIKNHFIQAPTILDVDTI